VASRSPVVEQSERALYAAEFGLSRSGARVGPIAYLRETWTRRHFILAYARAKTDADNASTSLGWVWEVLTPILNAAVYYLIFGVLLGRGGGKMTEGEYIGFLVIGVFLFGYTNRALTAGAKSKRYH